MRGVMGQNTMSEPMSSGEIEDVLSSIRRLVSEDLRPAVAQTEGQKPAPQAAGSKLLLTPALRVVAGQDDAAKPKPSLENSATPAPKVPAAPLMEDVEAWPEDEVDAEDEAQADAPDFVLENGADVGLSGGDVMGTGQTDEDWLPEASDENEPYPGWASDATPIVNSAAEAAPDMTRVVSEIAAGVSDSEDDWEPETGDALVSGVSWQSPEWVEEAELVDDLGNQAVAAAAKGIADKAEAAAVAEIMARAEQAKADSAEAKPKVDPAESAATEDDIFADDEGYYDETVLRDLVRDLIREELSGTLGERITRNVRKLVRAEINRALTARDFD